MTRKAPETLYALTDRLGPVEVGRQLGEHHTTISRARRGETDVSTKLLGKCVAAWGDTFDAEGSALEWYRARKDAAEREAAKKATTDAA